MMFCQTAIAVADASHVSEVRRHVSHLGADVGFDESQRSNAAIVATELVKNLARYAQGGKILLRTYEDSGMAGLEILSIDRGPGIVDVGQSLVDGHSTGGTPGNGLGAVRRLSTEFDIFSSQPGGTVVMSRIQKGSPRHPKMKQFEWGVVSLPAPHEAVCGDTWRIAERDGELSLLVADGLGHGPLAADAAEIAAITFEEDPFAVVSEYFQRAHVRMQGSRGAAVAVSQINATNGILNFMGVGNIAASLRSCQESKARGLISHNGTMGVALRNTRQFDYELPREALLVMHSDGLQSRWSLEPYPGLVNRHPVVIANVLARDFTRGRDDVTVAVVRISASYSG